MIKSQKFTNYFSNKKKALRIKKSYQSRYAKKIERQE